MDMAGFSPCLHRVPSERHPGVVGAWSPLLTLSRHLPASARPGVQHILPPRTRSGADGTPWDVWWRCLGCSRVCSVPIPVPTMSPPKQCGCTRGDGSQPLLLQQPPSVELTRLSAGFWVRRPRVVTPQLPVSICMEKNRCHRPSGFGKVRLALLPSPWDRAWSRDLSPGSPSTPTTLPSSHGSVLLPAGTDFFWRWIPPRANTLGSLGERTQSH